jgi:1-acyl-sn-glycerol-3-phosphate acyltransferase
MLRWLPAPLRGTAAVLLLVLNTLFWCWFLFAAALLKVLLPFTPVQRLLRHGMHRVAETWIAGNMAWMDAVGPIAWDVQGLPTPDRQRSYLVTSNHQSWVDILVLQYQFNRRLPMLKFFLKKELIWVPVIGLCWWALEFPFMQRHSRATLDKHPEKRGEDLAATRAACARFKTNPVCVFNFLEGTRFTAAKHAAQGSPFRHLLKPRAGGIAFVLDAMGEQLAGMVDVTLHYPDGRPTFWQLLCGQVPRVRVQIAARPIPSAFIGRSYDEDAGYRAEFQRWVNALWEDKDALLDRLHADR